MAFVQELSAALHQQGKLLSITTPVLFDPTTGKKGYTVYDWASIADSIDRLRIMTYDYSTSSPGPIGPIAWVEQTIQYAVMVVPASQVFIGVAGVGRDWITKVVGVCPSIYAKAMKVGAGAARVVIRDGAGVAARSGAGPGLSLMPPAPAADRDAGGEYDEAADNDFERRAQKPRVHVA